MIKKIRNLVRTIAENKSKLLIIEQKNLSIEKLLRENNWGNIFNTAISGSPWFKNLPLNVGRWAANYSLLYILYRTLNEIKPQNILELGLGETTKMIQAYKRLHNKESHCTTIEQSSEWIEIKIKDGLSKEFIDIIKADVEKINIKGFETLAFINLPELLISKNRKFNLILIDGPWGSNNYSRYNIIELVNKGFLDDDFIIIVDDFERKGEQETFEDLKDALVKNNYGFVIGYYAGSKTQVIITTAKFEYLTSL